MTRTPLGWIAALVVASGAAAHADNRPAPAPAAKPFVDAGIAAYGAGDYETAVKELSAAYKIDPQPAILYAWAQALRLGKRCAEAIPLYRRYIATNPKEAQVAAAQNGISLCEKALPAEPATAPGAEAEPEAAPAPAPATAESPAQPGPTTAEPTEPATAESPAQPGPPRDAPGSDRWYADPIGGGLVIGGAVSLGLGIGFLVRSSQNRSAAEDADFRGDFVELLDTATLQRRIGVAGLCVGAALVTGGVVRYVMQRERRPAATIAITGGGIVIRASF